MERLFKLLKECGVDTYKVKCVDSESVELFYVLNKLETNRATDVHEVEVTIYIDKDNKRGQSSFSYNPALDDEDIKAIIEKKKYSAAFALNQYYEIPSDSGEEVLKLSSNFDDMSLNEAGERIVKAVLKAKQYKEGTFSANEIFITKEKVRILNSKGVDHSYTHYIGFIELIPSWEEGEEEVETYHSFRFSSLDEEDITNKVNEAMELTKARFEAKKLELDKPVKVIIEGEDVAYYFGFFASNLSYDYKYQHMNRFELGESTQGDDITGTKLNIEAVPYYDGASASKSIDDDGVVLKPVTLVEDGIAKNLYGSYRMGYYLGVKEPTGILPIIKVAPGEKSFNEMKKEPYVRCVKFSSFQLEENSGFFGGEVRLGFYFDGEKEIPVTGFSIAGNIHELKSKVILSKELQVISRFVGPKYLEIKDMTIN